MQNQPILSSFSSIAVVGVTFSGIIFGLLGCQSASQTNTPASPQTSVPATASPTTSPAPSAPVPPASPIPTPSLIPSAASPAPTEALEIEPEVEADIESEEPSEPQLLAGDPEMCSITQARVEDPDPPTNLRFSPDASADDNIAARVDNGLLLSVRGERDEWLQVDFPNSSVEEEDVWVAKSVVAYSCNQKVQTIRFPEGASGAIASDRFIGGGSHQYLLEAAVGQTMIITAIDGPLPFVFAPNDSNRQQELTGVGGQSGGSAKIQLPADGEYVLELISNRKGYAYEFIVEVK